MLAHVLWWRTTGSNTVGSVFTDSILNGIGKYSSLCSLQICPPCLIFFCESYTFLALSTTGWQDSCQISRFWPGIGSKTWLAHDLRDSNLYCAGNSQWTGYDHSYCFRINNGVIFNEPSILNTYTKLGSWSKKRCNDRVHPLNQNISLINICCKPDGNSESMYQVYVSRNCFDKWFYGKECDT